MFVNRSLVVRCVAFVLLSSLTVPVIAQVSFGSSADFERNLSLVRSLEQRRVAVRFEDTSLTDAAAYLAEQAGIEILLDTKAMQEAGIDWQTPVTYASRTQSAREVLESVLQQIGLTLQPKDSAIVITTPERRDQDLEIRVYPVRDLILVGSGREAWHDFQPLMDLIAVTIAPGSWQDVGGPASIEEFPVGALLVISQTFQVHEQIERLLTTLREAQRRQGITAPEPTLARTKSADRLDPVADVAPDRARSRRYVSPTAAWAQPRIHAAGK